MIVDIHSHFYPRSFTEYLRKRDVPPFVRADRTTERFKLFNGDLGVEFSEDFQDLSAKLAFMDRSGIDHSVISVGNPWLDLDAGEAVVGSHDVPDERVRGERLDRGDGCDRRGP